ncbi:Phage anti-repressor protein [Vreelandella subterranea]|uniref:Phage anti-repressor protein n=1 Tax=Vreelandella subterranea TaxID=416874 RepID=A0A1H9UJJ3_9GAMM|nr:antA/AntB antirepressor family protein [Halomonas subterranea]SES09616.1 Phage anti-repressor protein [Halomonas subterranea]
MNDMMIPVFQSEEALLCNARDLHEFLEVGRAFSSWILDRIRQYGFEEGEDYITVQNLSSPDLVSSKARPQKMIDYHLTIGMAKELAMIENNAMGRKVRRYFIQRERQAVALLKQQATEVQPLEQVRKRIKDTPKFRYLLILQEQSRTLARELAKNEDPRERFNLHCALRQVNDAIGLPTEPLEVWNATHLPPSPPQIAST